MSALDGFYTLWSKARDTFGEGTPQTGDQFDASPQLSQAQATLDRAAPGSQWTGTAANAYGAANTRHQEVTDAAASVPPGKDQKLAQAWPTQEADHAKCVAAAPDPPERRAFLSSGEHPRSDFPMSAPAPGWPEPAK